MRRTGRGAPRRIEGQQLFDQKLKQHLELDHALSILFTKNQSPYVTVDDFDSLESTNHFGKMQEAFRCINGIRKGPFENKKCGGDSSILGCLAQVCSVMQYPNWKPKWMLAYIITWLSHNKLLRRSLFEKSIQWMESGKYRIELLSREQKPNGSTEQLNLIIIISRNLASLQDINFYLEQPSVVDLDTIMINGQDPFR